MSTYGRQGPARRVGAGHGWAGRGVGPPGETLGAIPVGDLVPRQQWEQSAAELSERYAGFIDARSLSFEEQLAALASLVPLAMQVVEEARDTIERLNNENEALRGQEHIEDAVFAEEPIVPHAPPGEHLCIHHHNGVGSTHPCICSRGENHYE